MTLTPSTPACFVTCPVCEAEFATPEMLRANKIIACSLVVEADDRLVERLRAHAKLFRDSGTNLILAKDFEEAAERIEALSGKPKTGDDNWGKARADGGAP